MPRSGRTMRRRQELIRRLKTVRGKSPAGLSSLWGATVPSFDAATARRMAQASDVAYFIDQPGGPAACPLYASVGFQSVPATVVADSINAALIGTTATEVIVAFRGTLPFGREDTTTFIASVRDLLNDVQVRLVTADYAAGEVHRGFRNAGRRVARRLAGRPAAAVIEPIAGDPDRAQQGGAMARLAALRLQTEAEITAAAVYSYGAPCAGDTAFARDYSARIQSDWRFENTDDLVPHLPPTASALDVMAASFITPAALPRLLSHAYAHVGTLEFLNWEGGITEGDSLLLHGLCAARLAEVIAAGDPDIITQAHSLEQAYLPKL